MRLDGDNPRTLVRVARLERDKSMINPSTREEGLQRAEDLLTKALEIDKGYPDAQAMKAAVILDRGGDLEQAEWLLKQIKRRDNSFAMVQKARVKIRRGLYEDVERILEKAIKKEKSNHSAFAAQGEFWEAQGQVFHAFEAYRSAKERSPKNSPARIAYDQHLTRLGALIESGQAADMMKVVPTDDKAQAADSATADEAGPRRDPGKTTIRRKRQGDDSEADAEKSTEAADHTDAIDDAATVDTAEATEETVEATEATEETVEPTEATEETVEPTEATEETVEAAEATEETVEAAEATEETVEAAGDSDKEEASAESTTDAANDASNDTSDEEGTTPSA